MATNFPVEPDAARTRLTSLTDDGRALADRVAPIPWGLMIAAGGAVAWFVAEASFKNPWADYQPPDSAFFPIIALLIIGHLVQREVGIRFRRIPAGSWVILGGVALFALAMFSVSLALASLDLRVWVLAPVLLTWAVSTWGAVVFLRALGSGLRRE